jgi:hypothetical protein
MVSVRCLFKSSGLCFEMCCSVVATRELAKSKVELETNEVARKNSQTYKPKTRRRDGSTVMVYR